MWMTLGFSGKEGGNKFPCLFYSWEFNIRKKQHHQQKQQEKQEQNKTKQENIWTFSQFWVTDRKVEFIAKGLAVV